MSHTAIQAEDLGKMYALGSVSQDGARYRTLRETLMEGARKVFTKNGAQQRHEEFWALRGLSFEIAQGDVVGIIGRNGAGKSTLLKILSRITEPTTGKIRIKGRVASLLEVGTGFHQELTGRENIFLNGAILGMSKAEIKAKFDEIVAFAEVEKFLDTPVKRYSSGMYVRLAFAVAAHLEPEILVVDEVLAVGDLEFQRKCLGKMEEVSRGGRTVLFVSHNMGAVSRLCGRGFLLSQGKLILQDTARAAVDAYLQQDANTQPTVEWTAGTGPGDETFRLRRVAFSQENAVSGVQVDITRPLQIEIETDIQSGGKNVALGLQIVDSRGEIVLHTSDVMAPRRDLQIPGRHLHVCTLPAYALNSGQYSLTLLADEPHVRVLFVRENVLAWTVEATSEQMGRYGSGAWKGMMGPGLAQWNVRQHE